MPRRDRAGEVVNWPIGGAGSHTPAGAVASWARTTDGRHTGPVAGLLVRVLVVDDQRPFRMAAAAVLKRMPDFELVGQSETGEDAVAAAEALRPDLVLMDVRLPGISGIEAAGRVAATTPSSVVVLCSTYARDDLPFGLDAPGIAGYLHKEELRAPALRELWARLGPTVAS